MAEEDQGERTEEATQTRRDDFRKRGQVAHTRELASSLVLLAAGGALVMLSRFFLSNLFDIFNYSFGSNMIDLVKEGHIVEALQFSGIKIIILVGPVLFAAMLIGVMSSVAQIGFMNVEDALTPDLDKINPLQGFGRIFSLRALVEGLKSILKLIAVGVVMYLLLKGEFRQFPYLLTYKIPQILEYIGVVIVKLLLGAGFFMLVLSVADYFFQRWDLEKKMMMTKLEIKEELKSREGDPQIKARIRRIQREMANKRMMADVPKGDVVITNPTHIAVVLKYDSALPAPQLLAKGADEVAERIKALARESNIPVIENKPLARTIYKTMKIGQLIPRELFVAVAEVLSYVFRLRKRKVQR